MSHIGLCSLPACLFLSCPAAPHSSLLSPPCLFRGGKVQGGTTENLALCCLGSNSGLCVALSAASSNISMFLDMLEMGQILHHIVQLWVKASGWWMHALCAQPVNMIRPLYSPCMALKDAIFIGEGILIRCIQWWMGFCAPYTGAEKQQHIIKGKGPSTHIKSAVRWTDVMQFDAPVSSFTSPMSPIGKTSRRNRLQTL